MIRLISATIATAADAKLERFSTFRDGTGTTLSGRTGNLPVVAGYQPAIQVVPLQCSGVSSERRKSASPNQPRADLCPRHSNPGLTSEYRMNYPQVAAQYNDSIHGRALLKMGLIVAPCCNDCHGLRPLVGAHLTPAKALTCFGLALPGELA